MLSLNWISTEFTITLSAAVDRLMPVELWKIPVCPAVAQLSWAQHVLSPFHDVSLSSVLCFLFSVANHKEFLPSLASEGWHGGGPLGLRSSEHVLSHCSAPPAPERWAAASRAAWLSCVRRWWAEPAGQSPSIWSTQRLSVGWPSSTWPLPRVTPPSSRPSSSGGKAGVLLTHQEALSVATSGRKSGHSGRMGSSQQRSLSEDSSSEFCELLPKKYWARC